MGKIITRGLDLKSYAQAREDVLLHRVLHHVHHEHGFYIDIGAYHPTIDSVTKHFYDHGWRGINVEPSIELFPAFASERPRDINLQVAVSDKAGRTTFHSVEGQLGTLDQNVANTHVSNGFSSRSYEVDITTLTKICEEHAPRDIHFLKVDVEGHEAAALRGMDFKRFRPWVMVVEATVPNRYDLLTHHEWEGTLMMAGYQFALSSLPNRYYIANEHEDLASKLSLPVDDYVLARHVDEIERLRHELDVIRQ